MRRTFALGCLVASAQCFATSTLSLHLRASARQTPLTAPTMCTAPRTDDARVARRPAVLSALAALAALPAAAAAEDDTAEFERLQKEAQKLKQLIENTKSAALPDAPSFNKGGAPAAKAGKEVKLPEEPPKVVSIEAQRPTPEAARQPKEVIKLLLESLVNNDTPEEDFGLKTVVGFSSSVNPYYSQPPQRFIQAVRNSGYSILLGNYDTASVGKPDQGKGDDGVPYQVFPVKISATNRAFLIAGVDNKYLYDAPDGSAFCLFNWILSQDPKTKAWLLDTVYLVPNEKKKAE